jgi:hypothetical protein
MPRRTTLTLEDDVFDEVRREARRTGKSVKQVVNDALRTGLHAPARPQPFEVRPRRLGLKPGFDFDDVEGLLEEIEGPRRR